MTRHLRKIQKFLLLFLVGICMLTGCNSVSSMEENTDTEAKIEAVCEEETESPTEEQMTEEQTTEEQATEESEQFTTLEEVAELGVQEDMLAYWLVLNNKKAFVSMKEGGQKFFLNEYFWFINSVTSEYYAYDFMIVDMDGDGLEEVVLECHPGTTQLLHYEDGEVYSYRFDGRSMLNIHINGMYISSDGAASTRVYRLTELNKDGYTEETLARMHNDYYEVEGVEATEEEFFDYMDYIKSIDVAEEIEFTENMLDQQLLGDLSEQEIALVKRLPTENLIEEDPNYEEYKQILELYAAVLTGEEAAVYVVDDTFWEDMGAELLWKYFSIVDMDGDGGGLELVFVCEYDVIRVLHYEEGNVYGYKFRTYSTDTPVITTDGVFRTDDLSPTGYARIASFDEDGYKIEPVEDYESSSHDRTRYYFFSDETIKQWLK